MAYDICSTTPPEELAAGFGAASPDPADLAVAYAAGYTERFRQAGHEGCLDGLTGAPRAYP